MNIILGLTLSRNTFQKKTTTLISEICRHGLDNNLSTDAVLVDLSKAFDCISHDLLIAKLHAYGLDFDKVMFLHNYLKHRKQSVKTILVFSELYIRVFHKAQY